MSTKDRESYYAGLVGTIPNTVSRYAKVGDRSFQTVVFESGKAILDAELQLHQDATQYAANLLNQAQAPSGWIRGQTHHDGYFDYTTVTAPIGFVDSTGTHLDGSTLVNAFLLPRLMVQVAGMPIVVEYTYTTTDGYNLVPLTAATAYDGTPLTVKRTDFVFLEVWKALVAPSVASRGSVTVVTFGDIVAGDLITIDGHNLTAVAGAPAADEFQIGVSNDATATNIAAALNLGTNWWATNDSVKAKAFGPVVEIYALVPGVAGDLITLAVTLTNPGCITVSGPNLTGGADRPNKPDQNHLFRHGNVLSPTGTWLDDEIVDPVVNQETTQRVQVQYRIRASGRSEAINYKTHPDGFSTQSGGLYTIFAQGGQAAPVADYPFVPADRTTVVLNSDATDYDVEDVGLWIAGDGSVTSAQDLNTLDGYVYAIPICFVHRYNDASSGGGGGLGFNPDSNTNGAPLHDHPGYAGAIGAIPAGCSDRPDGNFADVIVQDNLLDLRRHIIFPGIDTAAELQFQIQSILDGSTRTWSIDTADKEELGNGSGDVSTRPLVCNEIGRSVANGGIGDTTTRGEFVREFDHVARRFGDQSIVERLVMAFYPGDRDTAGGPAVPPGTLNDGKYVTKAGGAATRWYEDDRLRLDLTLLDATTLGGIFQGLDGGGSSSILPTYMADVMPLGTVITDVLSIRHDDGNSGGAIDQNVMVKSIIGLGTQCVDIVLDSNPLVANGGGIAPPDIYPLVDTGAGVNGSPRRIFVEVEITYPIGEGLTDTFFHGLTPDATVYDFTAGVGPGPVIAEDSSQEPNDMEVLVSPQFRDGYREVQLEYVANDTTGHAIGDKHPGTAVGVVHPEYVVSATTTTLRFPRRLAYDITQTEVYDTLAAAPVNIDTANTAWGSSSRLVTLLNPLTAAQTLCRIKYFPQDPIPNYGRGGYQLGVYYRTNAPQTAGVSDIAPGTGEGGVLPTTLHVEPLYLGPDVWTNQIGSGSQDRGFPYSAPMDQIPINDGALPTHYEWFLCATADVAIDDFNTDTGIIALRPFVQADGQNVLEFGGPAATHKPRKDAEFRVYYPYARDDLYRPTILSQPMFGAVRHKVLFPFLARAVETIAGSDGGILYRKNELLLIVLSRFAELDADNTVRFTDPVATNRTCAALYRTRNLLVMVGDRATIP